MNSWPLGTFDHLEFHPIFSISPGIRFELVMTLEINTLKQLFNIWTIRCNLMLFQQWCDPIKSLPSIFNTISNPKEFLNYAHCWYSTSKLIISSPCKCCCVWLWHGLMQQRQLSHVYYYLMKNSMQKKTAQTSEMFEQKYEFSEREKRRAIEIEREREKMFAHLIETGFNSFTSKIGHDVSYRVCNVHRQCIYLCKWREVDGALATKSYIDGMEYWIDDKNLCKQVIITGAHRKSCSILPTTTNNNKIYSIKMSARMNKR